ncbi:MAG: M3 family metallopeptidase [Actinomycetaceae bacterium]|nr:M3 family metallopeptidase [Arcanobacterium sp.]MDD7687197.1 M3 family metallopeptidase [Actinomycetaceae bacterium]MDY5273506.1 M3 family metallopeptidase [Arcanobacterium sp.]
MDTHASASARDAVTDRAHDAAPTTEHRPHDAKLHRNHVLHNAASQGHEPRSTVDNAAADSAAAGSPTVNSAAVNAVLAPSTLPYGLPDWKAIHNSDLLPALKIAIEHQKQAWQTIGAHPEPATISNTVRALVAADAEITRVLNILETLTSSLGGEELDAIEAEASSLTTAHFTSFYHDGAIYRRLLELEKSGELNHDSQARELVQSWLRDFQLNGIALAPDQQQKVRELDERIARAETEFEQRVVKAMGENAPEFSDAAELAGLSDGEIERARTPRGHYRLELANTTNQPVQARLRNPETRAAVLAASMERGFGSHPDSDTRALVIDIARSRAERAQLLGFANHAELVAQREMAGSAQAIADLLTSVAQPAFAAAREQAQQLAELARAEQGERPFSASDWLYYQEHMGREIGLDSAELAPYLELTNVVERGIFFAAHELYGLSFEERADLSGYAPSVRTWEVKDESGAGIALFQADYFRRDGKHGGAWMNELGTADPATGSLPSIMNNCNFAEPPAGEPALLTWDNVITVFHEFGHALHAFLSHTRYASAAGTNVPRDFVEMPSQLNEMWAYNPRVLANYARHYATGEPLPAALAEKLVAGQHFGKPFETAELEAAALLDHEWHRHGPDDLPSTPDEVESFETAALARYHVDSALIPPRYRSTYFSHTFGGGYDAGYYSYTWAEAIAADIEAWFTHEMDHDGDGGLNRAAGRKFADEVLSRGASRPPMESVIALLGRPPRAEAILDRLGLR